MQNPTKRIVGIVGPKGGVGKSTISANLALALTGLGSRVLAVDMDLGAANLHAIFGIRTYPNTLADFLYNKVSSLESIVQGVGVPGLEIICGGDVPGIANLPYQVKLKLIRHLAKLERNFVLLDLGGGGSTNVVDFVLVAQSNLFVTTPDVPSLMNLYSFMKTALFRRLTFLFKRQGGPDLLDLLARAKDPDSNPHLKTMEDLLREVRKTHPEVAEKIEKICAGFKPTIIVNRLRTASDARAGNVVRTLMEEYLNIFSSRIMTIREDPAVLSAAAMMRPLLLQNKTSPFVEDIRQIARVL
jgi:flagellar biosynthesis protein FlhG